MRHILLTLGAIPQGQSLQAVASVIRFPYKLESGAGTHGHVIYIGNHAFIIRFDAMLFSGMPASTNLAIHNP
jgi:hypothetical protein